MLVKNNTFITKGEYGELYTLSPQLRGSKNYLFFLGYLDFATSSVRSTKDV